MNFLVRPVYIDRLVIVANGAADGQQPTRERMREAIEERVAGIGGDTDSSRANTKNTEPQHDSVDCERDIGPSRPLVTAPYAVSPPRLVVVDASDVIARLANSAASASSLMNEFRQGAGRVPNGCSIAYALGSTSCSGVYEVTLAKTGRRLGTTKSRKRKFENGASTGEESSQDALYLQKTCSKLCKAAMLGRVRRLERLLLASEGKSQASGAPRSYASYKKSAGLYQEIWHRLRHDARSPLRSWSTFSRGHDKREVEDSFCDALDVQPTEGGTPLVTH